MLEFASPQWFWLFLIFIPIALYEYFIKRKKEVRITYPRVSFLKEILKFSSPLEYLPLILRMITLIFLIIALARPRLAHKKEEIIGNGIDIVIAIDVSGSMKALDFKPQNRLNAAIDVAQKFIDKRVNDRIGLVSFSEHSFTKTPLTLDYNILTKVLNDYEVDENGGGTAIGLGLATAISRLKESEAKSKVIILITDGENNTGEIEPLDAAELAKTFGIKVYTIGVGKGGYVDYPVDTPFGVQIQKVMINVDMILLDKIAKLTGTKKAYRAHNKSEFEQIMNEINQLETSEIKINNYFEYSELFGRFLILAFICLLIEFLYRTIINKQIPM